MPHSDVAQLALMRAGAGIGVCQVALARRTPGLVRVLPELAIRRTYHLVAHVDTRRIARIDEAYRFVVEEVEAAAGLFG